MLLLSVQQLEAVSFTGWRGETTPEFHHAALQLIGCPTLIRLDLDFLRPDILQAVGSSHIRSLRLVNMYDWLARGSNPLEQAVPPHTRPPAILLTHLVITENKEEIGAPLSPENNIHIGGLTNLRINPTPEPFTAEGDIPSLLSACTPILQRLRLDASKSPQRTRIIRVAHNFPAALQYKALDCLQAFSAMRSLQELVIDCNSYQRGVQGRINILEWLPSVLSALPSPSPLSAVNLTFRYHNQEEVDAEVPFWRLLDETLSSQDSFPRLRKVWIILAKFARWSPEISYVERCWAGLKAAGVLRVGCCDLYELVPLA